MTENIMLDIVKDLEARTTDLAPTVADVAKLEADLKSNRYSAQAIKEEITPKLNAAREKIRAAKNEANKAVAAMVNTYITDLQRMDALDPAELTDDFKLLNGGVTLTAHDIKFMLERNAKNRTMSQAILRYAKEHDITLPGVTYIDHDKEIRDAQTIPGTVALYVDHWMHTADAMNILKKMFYR